MADDTDDGERPLDALNVQLPGRILTLEVLMVLLLRQKPGAMKLLREAGDILDSIESNINATLMGGTDDNARKYQLLVFEAAREQLLKIEGEVRRDPVRRK